MSHRGSVTGNYASRVSHKQSISTEISRLQSKWSFLESLINKNEKYIESLNEQIVKLETRISITYSIQKKEEIRDWITEKENKIKTVNANNVKIENEIEDIKKKIIYYKKL